MTTLYVMAGTGGVGKTTVSSALGLALARAGKKTLVITIDPARRLAQDLGLNPDSGEVQQVPDRKLWGMVLNVRVTFDRVIRKFARSPEQATRVMSSPVYKGMTEALSGIQDYMALEALHEQVLGGQWEVVVLDTPPSGHVMDFFRAPGKMTRFFGGAAARWFAHVAKGTRLAGKALGMFWGGHFLEELSTFFASMESFFDGFTSRANELSALLRGPNARLLYVTTARRMERPESVEFQAQLREAGLGNVQTVLNRVLPDFGDSREEEQRLAKAGIDGDTIMKWKRACDWLRRESRFHRETAARMKGAVILEQAGYEVSTLDGLELLSHQLDRFVSGS